MVIAHIFIVGALVYTVYMITEIDEKVSNMQPCTCNS